MRFPGTIVRNILLFAACSLASFWQGHLQAQSVFSATQSSNATRIDYEYQGGQRYVYTHDADEYLFWSNGQIEHVEKRLNETYEIVYTFHEGYELKVAYAETFITSQGKFLIRSDYAENDPLNGADWAPFAAHYEYALVKVQDPVPGTYSPYPVGYKIWEVYRKGTGLSAPVANPGSSITSSSFVANWSSVSGATSYLLDVFSNSSLTDVVFKDLNVGSVTSYNVTNLTAGVTYYYRVRARSSSRTSSYSNLADATTPSPQPEIAVEVDGVDTVSGSTVNFSIYSLGVSVTKTFRIRNTGSKRLALSSYQWPSNSAFTSSAPALGSINPGSSITFTIKFTGASSITYSDVIRLYNDDANENPFVIYLRGKALLPSIYVEGYRDAGSSQISFEPTIEGRSRQRTVRITNNGDANLVIHQIEDLDPNDAFMRVSGPGSSSIAPGQSTTFTVQFSPGQVSNNLTGAMLIHSNDPAGQNIVFGTQDNHPNDVPRNPWRVEFNGQRLKAFPYLKVYHQGNRLASSAYEHDFGVVDVAPPVPNPQVAVFRIDNGGNIDLANIHVDIEGEHADEFEVNLPPPGALAPDGWAFFEVTFTPKDRGPAIDWIEQPERNVRDARLVIRSNDTTESPFFIHLAGKARILSPKISVGAEGVEYYDDSGGALEFGPVPTGSRDWKLVRITNQFDATADLVLGPSPTPILVNGLPSQDFSVEPPLKTVLKLDESTTMKVHFHPKDPVPPIARTAWISIPNNDTRLDIHGKNKSPFDFSVTGEASQGGPLIRIWERNPSERVSSGQRLDFGSLLVGKSRTRTFTMENIGNKPLNLGRVRPHGPHAGDFLKISLSTSSLAAGKKATLSITFNPGAPAVSEAREAQLEMPTNDPVLNPFRLHLRGAVGAPEIAVEDMSGNDLIDGGVPISFGSPGLADGATSISFTIKNTGTEMLSGLNVTKDGMHAADFTVATQPQKTVAAQGSTTFNVKFAPKARGRRSAFLRVASNDADESSFAIMVTGSGTTAAPGLMVEQPAGRELVKARTVVDAGTAAMGAETALPVFLLTNTGTLSLTGISARLSGAHAADFSILSAPAVNLAGGATSGLSLQFSPQGTGTREAVLHIASSDAAGELSVPLRGTGQVHEVQGPESALLIAGMPVTLGALPSVEGDFQWQKNTKAIPGAKGGQYFIPFAKLTDAGSYRLAVKTETAVSYSPTGELGVVEARRRNLVLPLKSTVTMEVNAAGNALGFEWLKNGMPIVQDGRVSGSRAAKMTLLNARFDDAGTYSCRIIGPGGTLEENLYDLAVIGSPPAFVAPLVMPEARAGSYYWLEPLMDPAADRVPASFSARGLPAGMQIDPVQGFIFGVPSAISEKPVMVTLTASNQAGSTSIQSQLRFVSLPSGIAGTYSGLVEREATLNGNLGDAITITITSSGHYSTRVRCDGKDYRFTVPIGLDPDGLTAEAQMYWGSGPSSHVFSLLFHLDTATGVASGTLQKPGGDPAAFRALKAVSSAGSRAGSYTAELKAASHIADHRRQPQGQGFALLKVSSSGVCTWSGKLADGSGITGSTTLAEGGKAGLFSLMPASPGSVLGWQEISAESGNLDGSVSWWKAPQKAGTRNYGSGIPLHDLTLYGGRYPQTLTPIMELLGVTSTNMELSFTGDGLGAGFTQPFTLSGVDGASLQANAFAMTLKMKASTGLFEGSFTLKDNDPTLAGPPFKILSRKATFSGVLVPRLGVGTGSFLLGDLPSPGPPKTTLSNSPVTSGGVKLRQVVP